MIPSHAPTSAFRLRLSALLLTTLATLAGCGVQSAPLARNPASTALSGIVHGGQQPVVGASIQLYTVGTTGDGSAATPLLTGPVLSGPGGSFSIGGDYSCTGATQVYLTATGGNPGLATPNPNLAMMTALGPCSALSASTFISVNELTTVAAVSALAPYMSSSTAIGSGPGDSTALANAFTLSSEYVNPSTGTTPGFNVPAGLTVPAAELATLANILAACINSAGGVASDGSSCGSLFADTTTTTGIAPANTIAALLNLADNPTLNTPQLFALSSAVAPFQPALTTTPPDFSVKLTPLPGVAALTVSPAGLIFPKTATGFAAPAQTLTVTNTGTGTVTLNGYTFTGINTTDFAQTTTCPSTLAAGAACTIQVIFTPIAAGSRVAQLAVASSAANSPSTVSLSGVSGAPSAGPVTLSPSSLSFKTAGVLQDVIVANYGSTPLTIRGITSSSSYFVVVGNTCGLSVPAQSVCTLSIASTGISYSNNQYGTYSGTVTIDDDASAGAQTLPVTSTNTLSVSVSPNAGFTLAFPAFPVNTTQTGSVTAAAPSYYVNGFLGAGLSGPNAADFALSPSSCSVNAGTGRPCSLSITFTPTATGIRTAKLSLNEGYVNVTGISQPAGPSFTVTYASSTFFQGQAVTNNYNIATDTDTYTILNNGSTTLTPKFTVSGGNAADFSTSSNCGLLAPKGTCSLQVTFTSATVGNFTSSVIINDAASSLTQTLPLSFQAYYPMLNPVGNTSFQPQTVGTTSASQTFSVYNGNTGPNLSLDHPVTITTPTTANFILTSPSTCGPSSTQACTFSVAFTPTSLGAFTDSITVTDQTSGNTAKVQLYGTGIAPVLSLSTRTVTFPSRAVGTTSVPTSVQITNTGTGTLTISSVTLNGAVNGNYTQTNNCTSVAANASCSIGITFAPTAAGPQNASITIVSNAPSSPDTITITGTAQ